MSRIIPPPTLPVSLADNDGLGRIQTRLWLIWSTVLTIVATIWCITLGPIPGIISVVVAKHILVAILILGLNIDRSKSDDS